MGTEVTTTYYALRAYFAPGAYVVRLGIFRTAHVYPTPQDIGSRVMPSDRLGAAILAA